MKPKIGSGARFKAVEAAAAKGGASNPAAVAASAGRKKYGAEKMAKLAQMGKMHSEHERGGYRMMHPHEEMM